MHGLKMSSPMKGTEEGGYASQCLEYAKTVAEQSGCYKMMLMTGSKRAETLHFCEQAGYNSRDKTAFIRWL